MSKLSTLPPSVVRELCQHLNVEGAGVRNWRDLITKVQDSPYDIFACDAFARNGLRPYTSPAEQVIADFIARAISVDQLYYMLSEMDAWGCMAVIEDHGKVTDTVVANMKRKREEQRSNWNLPVGSCDSTVTPPTDSTPSPDEHPEFGALPSRPSPSPLPPTAPKSPPTHFSTVPPRTSDHTPSHCYSHDTPSTPVTVLPHQQYHPHPTDQQGQLEGKLLPLPLYSSVGESSSCMSGEGYITPHIFGRTHPSCQPHMSGHVTGSSSDSSVFAYGSSNAYTDTTQTTPSSSQATPSSIEPISRSIGSDVSAAGGGLNILHFSYVELSEATGGFTEGMVGIGAFGTVFKAKIRGNGPYAIKKLHTEAEMGMHCGQFYEAFHRETFSQELQLLTRYHHRNILSLVAHSNDGYRPCLVYEYMENGSLAECLEGKTGMCLRWDLRLSIATQVADALHFLHTVNKPTCLVHGDIKSANILLDVHCVPKLSDFGLARELTSKPNSKSTISTRSNVVMGTMAYMAPEFMRNKKLTTRTDVYAFGVVMLELYTGQPAFTNDPGVKDRLLTDRLSDLLEDSELHREEVLMSADQHAGWPKEIALGLFDIISVCLQSKQRLRLSIRQVLDQLLILPQ